MIFDFFIKFLKKKKQTGCDHDWEFVSYGEYYKRKYLDGLDVPYYFKKQKKGAHQIPEYCRDYIATNYVCLKCGECKNQNEEFKRLYNLQEKEKRLAKKTARRRKMWAKQLWEDGCKKGI